MWTEAFFHPPDLEFSIQMVSVFCIPTMTVAGLGDKAVQNPWNVSEWPFGTVAAISPKGVELSLNHEILVAPALDHSYNYLLSVLMNRSTDTLRNCMGRHSTTHGFHAGS